MKRFPRFRFPLLDAAFALCALAPLCAAPLSAHADYSLSNVYTFDGEPDGDYPYSALTPTPDGSYYGITEVGGTANRGTVYKLATDGTVSIIHSFGDGSVVNDGNTPQARLTIGSDGLLYGITADGGANGYGVVFKMTTAGAVTILHSFAGDADGEYPDGGLTFGSDGNGYGTTGSSTSGSTAEDGTIYSVSPDGSSYLVQFRFNSGNAAKYGSGLHNTLTSVPGTTANQFYGTCSSGGPGGQGTLFEFTPGTSDGGGTLTVLHAFGDGSVASDGYNPAYGRLVFDAGNNIYGTTVSGGAQADGTVFKTAPDGTTTILHSFIGSDTPPDGANPFDGLYLASDGNFYGTTLAGGKYNDGTVFQISSDGSSYNVVYNFGDNSLQWARFDPVEDSDGNLLGTAFFYEGMPHGPQGKYVGLIYKLAAGLPNPVALSSVSVSPASLVGGLSNFTGTVSLSQPAFGDGAFVALRSSNASAASVPYTVTIPANSESATFPITSHSVKSTSNVTITATYNNSSATRTIQVVPQGALQSVALAATSAAGGVQLSGNRVNLTSRASTDTKVTLTSSNTAVATVPSSVIVPAHGAYQTFTVTTSPVTSPKNVTITATLNGVTATATLTVLPSLSSVKLAASSTQGGTSLTGNRIYFTGNVNADTQVALTSSNKAVATVPSSETILNGSNSHSFTVTTKAVTSSQTVTITATSGGITKTTTLTVTP